MSNWQCVLCEATNAGTAVRRVNGQSLICTWCAGELKRTERAFCPTCCTTYPRAEMSDGYCKPHKRALNAAYRAANREREKARVAAWKQAHPGPNNWHTARSNPARDRARALAWHHANREVALERQRAYRQQKAAENPNYWRERYQRAKLRAYRRLIGGTI